IRAASVEGTLEPTVLLSVADTAAAGRKLKSFLLQRKETAPNLEDTARKIGEFPLVEQAIYEAIDEHAEVRDDASNTLARLRRELRVVRNRMMDRLHSILRGSGYKDMIQDPVITTRDGRYCIPVKNEYRVQFGGLVHDQSSSGATVFMEPAPVVELGNELRQVEAKERQEVERILRELTSRVGQFAPDLMETVHALGELDFIFARAKLGQTMDAVEPVINKEGFVGLRRARHPLLSGAVMPIDVDLGREHTVLVITGPNTGGKTVTLKTTGLFAIMAQCGLRIPADEGSTLPVFLGVYADIGDEQSIQQSLSTFSAHITNIAGILKEVDKTGRRSLVLLDEAGAGTDPTEGAALAKAILSELLRKGARTIATTHYGELKEFAYSTPGVENASVEFDMATLRPTYRLLIGVPGASNAFSIAARLGLPEPVVDEARGMVGTDRAMLSDVIQRLTEDQRATETDLRKAERGALEVEQMREKAERELKQLKADRADTLMRAKTQADELLRGARKEIERVREELRQIEKQARKAAEEPGNVAALNQLRERIAGVSGKVERREAHVERTKVRKEPPPAVEAVTTDRTPPTVGDLVWVAGFNQRGTLLSEDAGGKAQVQIGSMRTTVPMDAVQRIVTPRPGSGGTATAQPAAPRKHEAGSDLRLRARSAISPEIQLLGLRADEALTKLDAYVDQACLAGLSPFRVVHGRGTGALKRMVWDFLRGHPNVSGFVHPSEEEGGTGVTVVELRE
ncbi:MAG: MutS2 family protein, partial [Armatimonadetes bacterium]|nr:MutS2 family protein [Armatimonadota bacterium]